ncbi:MAG: hypothetical protein LUG66_11330 [Clostridiales bacterium]|nr:hypothetical protein [Clostridiales bacterium]
MEQKALKTGCIISILILIVLLAAAVVFGYRYATRYYETDYYGCLSLSKNPQFSELVSIYGKPDEITVRPGLNARDERRYSCWAKYDDKLTAVFSSDNLILGDIGDRITAVYVYSTEFRFGRDNIGVGSSKSEIEKAYKKCYKVKNVGDKEDGLHYFDDYKHAEYTLDENDIVTEVTVIDY